MSTTEQESKNGSASQNRGGIPVASYNCREMERLAESIIAENSRSNIAEAQRDALLAALKRITDQTDAKYRFCADAPMPEAHRTWRGCIDEARAAIAAVEGEGA